MVLVTYELNSNVQWIPVAIVSIDSILSWAALTSSRLGKSHARESLRALAVNKTNRLQGISFSLIIIRVSLGIAGSDPVTFLASNGGEVVSESGGEYPLGFVIDREIELLGNRSHGGKAHDSSRDYSGTEGN